MHIQEVYGDFAELLRIIEQLRCNIIDLAKIYLLDVQHKDFRP